MAKPHPGGAVMAARKRHAAHSERAKKGHETRRTRKQAAGFGAMAGRNAHFQKVGGTRKRPKTPRQTLAG